MLHAILRLLESSKEHDMVFRTNLDLMLIPTNSDARSTEIGSKYFVFECNSFILEYGFKNCNLAIHSHTYYFQLYLYSLFWKLVSVSILTIVSLYFVKLIGSPDDASLGFLRSNNARRYVRQLPQYPKQQFSARFPNTAPGALDLLEKMLVFDPSKRIAGIVDELECSLKAQFFIPIKVRNYEI